MHFLLFYELSPEYLERRGQFRREHLQLALSAVQRGELLLAGTLADPVDEAVLLFESDTDAAVHAFVNADPYVREKLVLRWRVRPWTTVVGPTATNPIRLDQT